MSQIEIYNLDNISCCHYVSLCIVFVQWPMPNYISKCLIRVSSKNLAEYLISIFLKAIYLYMMRK